MMENKDAIYYLLYIKHHVIANSPNDIALDMAIEALKEAAKQPKTNGDKIRAMTDEELAEFIDTVTDCCSDGWMCDKCPIKSIGCDKDSFIEWLKQEVSEDAES